MLNFEPRKFKQSVTDNPTLWKQMEKPEKMRKVLSITFPRDMCTPTILAKKKMNLRDFQLPQFEIQL